MVSPTLTAERLPEPFLRPPRPAPDPKPSKNPGHQLEPRHSYTNKVGSRVDRPALPTLMCLGVLHEGSVPRSVPIASPIEFAYRANRQDAVDAVPVVEPARLVLGCPVFGNPNA
jgi:hypothetical protein